MSETVTQVSERAHRIAQAGAANALELRGVSRAFGALLAIENVDLQHLAWLGTIHGDRSCKNVRAGAALRACIDVLNLLR